MHSFRRGSAYHTALIAMIVLILLSLLFAILAFMAYDESQVLQIGDPEDRSTQEESLTRYIEKQESLKTEIEAKEEEIDGLRDRLRHLEIELAARRAYYDPHNQRWVLGGDAHQTGWQNTSMVVATSLETMQIQQQKLEESAAQAFVPMEDLTRQFQDDLHAVMQRITESDSRLEEDRAKLLQQLDDIDAASEAADKQFSQDSSTLATRRSQLDARIRELLELYLQWVTTLEPDGKVIKTNHDSNVVMIDIGAGDRVFDGLRFEVFQYIQGEYVVKGMVEVIETRAQMAIARIVAELEPDDQPIAKNDLIANPVFHRERPRVFFLAGEFKLYNKEDLEYFIELTGGAVRQDLAPGVDFLVAGDRSERIQDRAREFKLKAITEEQLVRYLTTTFPPKDQQQQQQ